MRYNELKYKEVNGKITITGITGRDANISIPAEIDGRPVTAIGSGAFKGRKSIKTVIIPDSVKYIGDEAFENCTNLISVNITEGVTTIGEGAFFGCESLTSADIPNSVTDIGQSAFSDCPDLVITAPQDSYAVRYAKKNGIRYVEV